METQAQLANLFHTTQHVVAWTSETGILVSGVQVRQVQGDANGEPFRSGLPLSPRRAILRVAAPAGVFCTYHTSTPGHDDCRVS